MSQIFLLELLHTSEKLEIFDVFRGSRKVTLAQYALTKLTLCTYGYKG